MNGYALAAATIWGYVILVALVISLACALVWHAGRAVHAVRVWRIRRRFNREAVSVALVRIGEHTRRDPVAAAQVRRRIDELARIQGVDR